MCGIAGIFHCRGNGDVDRGLVRRMTTRLAHRGPDGEGFHFEPGVGLGHRRLAIIDLNTGDQPMFSDDGKVAIVFNGEIYNFREIRRELEGMGQRFRSQSDTEVIIRGWQVWGEGVLQRLRGMFAFAIWDQTRDVLFLARDRMGKKPLYYAILDDGRLLFASELKALLLCPELPRALDLQAVEDYFAYGYVPDPKSIYRSVRKLPPATYLSVRRGAAPPAPERYWRPRFKAQTGLDEREAAGALIDHLREAVDIRRVSDVPIGAFLSGGVDSSAVVALMAETSPEQINTFSIAFRQAAYDESRYANAHAERYNTNHFVREVDADEFDLVDQLANMFDEPFGDSSAIPTYRVSAIARENVTVVLSGDGGDELFAGYRRYPWHVNEEKVRAMMPASMRRALLGFLGRAYPKLDWAPQRLRAKATFQELAQDTVGGYFMSVSRLHDAMRMALYSDGFKRQLDGYHAINVLEKHMADADTDNPLFQAQYADMQTWLPGDILTKVDRTSMAASLEARAPLLDHVLMEWSGSLPANMKLRQGNGKYLLKKALEPYVSHDILYRPKMGFSVPLKDWFRGPLRQPLKAALTSSLLADMQLFDMAYLRRLADEHIGGRFDHSAALWSLLMFEAFMRQVHTGSHESGAARLKA